MTQAGSTTLVAVDEADAVVGLIQMQSDGEIQAHLSALLVSRDW